MQASDQLPFFFFINLFIYLFLAVLGLHFCARAFSSCSEQGPLFIAVRGPLTVTASRCGAQAPDAQAQQLWLTGPAAPWHVGSSRTRARTHVPCIGRQTLKHCATREAPQLPFFNLKCFYVTSSVLQETIFPKFLSSLVFRQFESLSITGESFEGMDRGEARAFPSVYSDTSLPQGTRKISNNLTLHVMGL